MSPKGMHYITTKDKKYLEKLDRCGRYTVRIGAWYSKFTTQQRARFRRIVNSYIKEYDLDQRKHPVELTLVRYIAVTMVLIDHAFTDTLTKQKIDYVSGKEKWLFRSKKDIRESVQLLSTMSKKAVKSDGIHNFGMLRDGMREEEGLPESKKKIILPDGHDRRYHADGVQRTEE